MNGIRVLYIPMNSLSSIISFIFPVPKQVFVFSSSTILFPLYTLFFGFKQLYIHSAGLTFQFNVNFSIL